MRKRRITRGPYDPTFAIIDLSTLGPVEEKKKGKGMWSRGGTTEVYGHGVHSHSDYIYIPTAFM